MLGSDGNLHVYKTGSIPLADAVPPVAPTSVSSVEITAPSSNTANLTINSANGNPIPTGGLAYNGAGGGLIKTGSGSVTLSGRNSFTGGTTVSVGTLLVDAVNALPDGGSLTVGAEAALIFNSSSDGASSSANVTTAAPVTKKAVSSSVELMAPTATSCWMGAASGAPGYPGSGPTLQLPALAHPSSEVPAGALGAPGAALLVGSSSANRIVEDPAWLGQAANGSDDLDQHCKKAAAILALDAALAQFGR